MEKTKSTKPLTVEYDAQQDTLYLLFATEAKEGVGEEIGDEVFLRFDPDTHQIVNIEMLHFRSRLEQAFGPDMVYSDQLAISQLSFLPDSVIAQAVVRETPSEPYDARTGAGEENGES